MRAFSVTNQDKMRRRVAAAAVVVTHAGDCSGPSCRSKLATSAAPSGIIVAVRAACSIRHLLLILALCVPGCAKDPPPPSKLHFTKVGFVEQRTPMPFGLVLENRGPSPIELNNVQVQVDEHLLMTTAMYAPIKSMSMQVHLLDDEVAPDGSYSPLPEGEAFTIEPGQARTFKCVLQWTELSGEEAPMIAVLRGTLAVKHGHERLARSEPLLFVLQSREGALEAVLEAPETLWKNSAPKLQMLSMGDAQKSPTAAMLIEEFQKQGYIPRE